MATGSRLPLSPSPPSSSPAYTYPPIIIILTIVLLIFVFVGFFSVYCCRCFMQNILCTWNLRHNPTGTPVAGAASSTIVGGGLDPSIVQSFPLFTYSTVKDYRKEKYGLECAICLLEFKGSDVLRLLTTCCHVFHQECIDLWLGTHDTCPVCRRNLTSPAQSPAKSPIHGVQETEQIENMNICITINDENKDKSRGSDKGKGVSCNDDDEQNQVEKFSRSHSTGHSIRKKDNEEDRFTLNLPEDVKSRIIKGHNSSKSWSFGEYKAINSTNMGLKEVPRASGGDHRV